MTAQATATSARAMALAAQVEAANQQLIEMVQRCPDDGWHKRSASEGWPVGVLAHHVAVAAMVRGLSDAQLARTTTAFGGREMNVAQLIEGAVIGHPKQHLGSIRDALAS